MTKEELDIVKEQRYVAQNACDFAFNMYCYAVNAYEAAEKVSHEANSAYYTAKEQMENK